MHQIVGSIEFGLGISIEAPPVARRGFSLGNAYASQKFTYLAALSFVQFGHPNSQRHARDSQAVFGAREEVCLSMVLIFTPSNFYLLDLARNPLSDFKFKRGII
ncbi:MAG: hypothetical protein ACM33T_12435 [Solirubrobacterales bacterium]